MVGVTPPSKPANHTYLYKRKIMFRHVEGLIFPEMKVSYKDGGRYYHVDESRVYPSVTTVLKKGTDQSWLKKWRDRVGDREADKIMRQASVRGEAVHNIAEQYLRNNPDYNKKQMPNYLHSFNQIKPILDKHVGLIAGLELPLYSDFLRVAGRVDCIAKWDGKFAIIDFKTSRRVKEDEDVENYFLQESAYAYMFYERTGLVIPQIVTVMAIDGSEAKVWVAKSKDYLPKFMEVRAKVAE